MSENKNPYKSRKLWFAVGLIVTGSILLGFEIFDIDEFDSWKTFAIAVYSGYAVGNVGSHFVQSSKTSYTKDR